MGSNDKKNLKLALQELYESETESLNVELKVMRTQFSLLFVVFLVFIATAFANACSVKPGSLNPLDKVSYEKPYYSPKLMWKLPISEK